MKKEEEEEFCIHKIIQNHLLSFDLSTLSAVNLEL